MLFEDKKAADEQPNTSIISEIRDAVNGK